MRLLLDGRRIAGGQSARSPLVRALGELASHLPGWDLVQIVHAGECAVSTAGFRPLGAPPLDLSDPVGEDRHLAALCRELEVDVFLGAGESSAGGRVPTVRIDGGPMPGRRFLSHLDRADRLASIRLTADASEDVGSFARRCADAVRRAAAGEGSDAPLRSCEEHAIAAIAVRRRRRKLAFLTLRHRLSRWSTRLRSAFRLDTWTSLPRRMAARGLRR